MVREFSHRTLADAKRGRRRLLFATLAVLFLLAFDILSGGTLRGAARATVAGISNSAHRMRAAVTESGFFASKAALAREVASLRQSVASLTEQSAASKAIADENAHLRAMLHLTERDPGITAPVVSSFSASPYGTFLIGAGTGDPVSVGDLVLTEGGFVAGTVAEVRGRTSLVRTLFAPNASVEVIVGGSGTVAEGRGGGNARANLPRSVQLAPGDAVIAPSLGGRAVGVVGSVDSDPARAEQTAYISLPVNLSSLRFVYILSTP